MSDMIFLSARQGDLEAISVRCDLEAISVRCDLKAISVRCDLSAFVLIPQNGRPVGSHEP
jgi:hypothetical protein